MDKELIDKIKGGANCFEVIQKYSDIDLKKSGVNYVGNCPFHGEKTASFVVSPQKNRYKCFGCGASGNAVTFLMEYNNLDFIQAIKELAAIQHIAIEGEVPTQRLEIIRDKIAHEKALTASEMEALRNEEQKKLRGLIFHAKQADKKAASEYLRSRHIDPDKLPANSFFGSAPWVTKEGVQMPGGIVFLSSGEELLNKRYVGNLPDGMGKSYNKGLLENSFYTHTLRAELDTIWMTEGVINALSIYQTNRSAVASFATSNLYNEIKAVSFMRGKHIVLAADGDKAGARYIIKQAKFLLENQKDIGFKKLFAFVFPDPDLDANDLLGNIVEFEKVLRNKFYMQQLHSAFVAQELEKMADHNYWPKFTERLEPFGWSQQQGHIKTTGTAYISNNKSDSWDKDGCIIWERGNYNPLLRLKSVAKKVVIIPELNNAMFEDMGTQDEEIDLIQCAKFLTVHGLPVYVTHKDLLGFEGIDEDGDYTAIKEQNFIEVYSRLLNLVAPVHKTDLREKAILRAADFMSRLSESTYTVTYAKVAKIFNLSLTDWKTIINPMLRKSRGEKKSSQILKIEPELDDFVNPEEYSNANDLPPYVDQLFFIQNGFYKLRNKRGAEVIYMMKNRDDIVNPVSNFTLRVVGHLSHNDSPQNKRILELTNKRGQKEFMEIESGLLRNKTAFDAALYERGSMFFTGSKAQFERILSVESDRTPIWYELHVIGQQPEGFVAFEDGIFDYNKRQFLPCSDIGTVEYNGNTFYSPTVSSINAAIRGKQRDEHAGYFRYMKTPNDQRADFTRWAWLMNRVFSVDNSGKFATIFVIMSAFRDFIHRQHTRFPLFFMAGETNAGKSQVAQSIVAPFTGNMKFQNLNSDTDAAFFVMLEKFRNVPIVFDEYEDIKISPIKFQGLKAGYDGIGKSKKKDATSKALEVSEINCSIVYLGQYIPEQDDYALFNRSLSFFITKKDFSPEDEQMFDELRAMEGRGVTNILTQILGYRHLIEAHYRNTQIKVKDLLKQDLQRSGENFVERILNSVSEFLAVSEIFIGKTDLQFPFTFDEMYQIGRAKIISLSEMINKSNKVSKFFNSIQYLLSQEKITDGKEFKIETRDELKVKGKNGTDSIRLKKRTEVLFIRMNLLEQMYRDLIKLDSLKSNTLQTYLTNHPAFLGNAVNETFKWLARVKVPDSTGFIESVKEQSQRNTTAMAFDYQKLGLELQRETLSGYVEEQTPVTVSEDDMPF